MTWLFGKKNENKKVLDMNTINNQLEEVKAYERLLEEKLSYYIQEALNFRKVNDRRNLIFSLKKLKIVQSEYNKISGVKLTLKQLQLTMSSLRL